MTGRFLYITSQFPFGRGEAFLAAEVRTLLRLGANLTVAATRPQQRHPSFVTGVRAIALHNWSRANAFAALQTLLRHPRASAGIAFEMCRARYRLVAKIKNIAVLWKGLALARYVRLEGITHVHAHWLTTPSTVAYVAAHIANVSWSVSAHRFDLYADNWIAGKVAAASAVRVISERGATDLRLLLEPQLRDRIHVIHLGVRPPSLQSNVERNVGVLRICAVGSLVPVKGHRYLIDAVASLRDAGVSLTCSIAGEGPLRDVLRAHIERLGLQAIVTLRGHVPHDELMRELAGGSFDVMVHPSTEDGRLHEGIPVSLMEAMAFEVPCVTTDTGSICELVDSSCGVIIAQRDSEALAFAIRSLAGDVMLRLRLGAAARERIETRFDIDATAAALLELMTTDTKPKRDA